jgi:hypothetical protein
MDLDQELTFQSVLDPEPDPTFTNYEIHHSFFDGLIKVSDLHPGAKPPVTDLDLVKSFRSLRIQIHNTGL